MGLKKRQRKMGRKIKSIPQGGGGKELFRREQKQGNEKESWDVDMDWGQWKTGLKSLDLRSLGNVILQLSQNQIVGEKK